MKLAILGAALTALALPAGAATVDPNGAFHSEGRVYLSMMDGFISFAGDVPGNGFILGDGGLLTGLYTTGFGVIEASGWAGDFFVSDALGDVVLGGTFAGLRLGDYMLSGIASITGGSAAHFFGTTAILSFLSPDLVAEHAFDGTTVLQIEAAMPAPIPLPAGLPLVLTGLGALAMLRRRAG